MTRDEMIRIYNSNKKASGYILGTCIDNEVTLTIIERDLPDWAFTQGIASDGNGASIRFRPSKLDKLKIRKLGTSFPLCTLDELKSSKYNKGEEFEHRVYKWFNREWKKDNVPFYKGADITINGKGYEIKFEMGTFAVQSALMILGGN